jgi:uncharacterized protein (DUF2141 family)
MPASRPSQSSPRPSHPARRGQASYLLGAGKLSAVFLLSIVLSVALPGRYPQNPVPDPSLHTLTVVVENVNQDGGNIGVLVFNSTKGWPEDRFAALHDIVVPAHPGSITIKVPGLPEGDYAVAVAHDVNKNHKLDKNFLGVPKEQWGMSNNPHANIKAPSFATAKFSLTGDQEIHIKLR